MKIIQNNLYEIWSELTDMLLEGKENSKENFKKEGKKAWSVIMKCSEKLSDNSKAYATFWAAWGNCKVTYDELSKVLTKNQNKWEWKSESTPVTENQVKWLINDAREKIRSYAHVEIEHIKKLKK